ncbi:MULTISPECIES: hypothetical protein [Bacteroidota]|uniref:hypothetical protein n=1 Tax=Bacteroidota TaxID=976 RepID=UPI00328F94C2
MKISNTFKITWWILLLLILVILIGFRFEDIINGTAKSFDIFLFIIFIALMLAPIFAEIELFGIKLKQEIEDLKNDINLKFGDIKNEIRVSQRQIVNTTFQGFGPPPPDNKLPELEFEIDRILKERLKQHGIDSYQPYETKMDVPVNNLQMFKVRYNIETQLRRIWENRFDNGEFNGRIKHQPLMRIIEDLTKFEILDRNFYGILREILSICNYAIHGESVTDSQAGFVIKNSQQVLEYLMQTK